MKEGRKRSIAKAITWRVIASLTTAVIVYVVTGKASIALGAGLVDAIIKLVFYYGHERAWNKIAWDRG